MSDYTTQLYCSLLVLFTSVASTPTGVTATRNGYNSVLVSWTAPSPAPAGYEVFHQTTGDADRISVGNTTSTMMTVTGLTLGITYYIFVVSFGAEGAPVLPSAHGNAPGITLCELYTMLQVNTYACVYIYNTHAYAYTIFVSLLLMPLLQIFDNMMKISYPAATTEWYTNTHSRHHLHHGVMDLSVSVFS